MISEKVIKQKEKYKVIRALLIAPLMIPLFSAIPALILGQRIDDLGVSIILAMALVSYLVTIFIGLPTFYFLRFFNCLNLITLSISGAVLGAIVGIVAGINGKTSFDLLLGATLGLLNASMFGLLAGVKVFNNRVTRYRKH
ncbi:hypothetical protein [Kangiella marina]|uniref:Uncharacterized protein n=1 Tax=Kangiella marina TaxID=1079178 RepID=A0ABP8ID74_9GAMM